MIIFPDGEETAHPTTRTGEFGDSFPHACGAGGNTVRKCSQLPNPSGAGDTSSGVGRRNYACLLLQVVFFVFFLLLTLLRHTTGQHRVNAGYSKPPASKRSWKECSLTSWSGFASFSLGRFSSSKSPPGERRFREIGGKLPSQHLPAAVTAKNPAAGLPRLA